MGSPHPKVSQRLWPLSPLDPAKETEREGLRNFTKPSSILAKPGASEYCFYHEAGLGASRTHLTSQSPHCSSP